MQNEKRWLLEKQRFIYQISNYFGDKSGMHYRNKEYVVIGDKLYQQKGGNGMEVKRLTKELSGILKEIGQGK